MHELSIAHSLVSMAAAAIRSDPEFEPATSKVSEVHLRLGQMGGVVKDALHFCYDIAAEDTILAGSRLVIDELPIVVFCSVCHREVELPDIQRFRCPTCNTPSGDVRQGKELELVSIHFEQRSPESESSQPVFNPQSP